MSLHLIDLLCLQWSMLTGNSRNAPNKDYSIKGSKENSILGAINGISIIATTYGCGIIPEIQVLFHSLCKLLYMLYVEF